MEDADDVSGQRAGADTRVYYFPISFSTTPDRFADDQKACEAMCPAAEVELYYHDVALSAAPDGELDAAAAMMSVVGEPYGKLPTAFSYREQFDDACTCGGPGGSPWTHGAAGPAEPAADAEIPSGFTPVPVPRPDPSEDPETLANRHGGFMARDLGGMPLASAEPAGDRPVRIVLPAYGVDPEKDSVVLRQVSE